MTEERGRRDLQREQTRKKVYEAALVVFRRDGVEAARIDDIAELAGVARGTFYFHFPTRQDVLRELLIESQQDVVLDLDKLPEDTPIAVVLDRIVVAIARRWKPDPRLFAEVSTIALTVPRDGLQAMAMRNPALLALVPRIYSAVKRGELEDRFPPELLASFFLVNVFAASLAWCAAPELDLAGLLKNVVAFFLKAASR